MTSYKAILPALPTISNSSPSNNYIFSSITTNLSHHYQTSSSSSSYKSYKSSKKSFSWTSHSFKDGGITTTTKSVMQETKEKLRNSLLLKLSPPVPTINAQALDMNSDFSNGSYSGFYDFGYEQKIINDNFADCLITTNINPFFDDLIIARR